MKNHDVFAFMVALIGFSLVVLLVAVVGAGR